MQARRNVLKALSAAAPLPPWQVRSPRAARMPADRLTIIGHAVHKAAATTGAGGDVTAPWRAKQGVDIEWLTFGVEAAQRARVQGGEPLPRATPTSCSSSIATPGRSSPDCSRICARGRRRTRFPTSPKIPAGMVAGAHLRRQDHRHPFRHATHGLHYNTEFFAEKGVTEPPTHRWSEAVALAEKLTFKRADGVQVYGLVMNFDDPATPIDWIRGFGGDFITSDYKVVIDQPAAVRGVTALVGSVQEGRAAQEFDEPQDRGRHDVHAAGPRRDDQQPVQPVHQLQRRQGEQVSGEDRGGRAAARRSTASRCRRRPRSGRWRFRATAATRSARGASSSSCRNPRARSPRR